MTHIWCNKVITNEMHFIFVYHSVARRIKHPVNHSIAKFLATNIFHQNVSHHRNSALLVQHNSCTEMLFPRINCKYISFANGGETKE